MKMFGIGLITFLLLAASPQGREKEEDSSKEEKHPLEEVIVVTAARREQPLMQAVSLVSVIRAEDLVQSPALVLDDLLRRIPGFSLFRRSSSRAAHPTTQGVSLRGIGPSGTSRSLVLFDGVPLNDPFWRLDLLESVSDPVTPIGRGGARGHQSTLRKLRPGRNHPVDNTSTQRGHSGSAGSTGQPEVL